MENKLTSILQEKVDQAKGLIDSAAEKISEIKDAGSEKLDAYVDELLQGVPLIEEAGFEVSGINIDLGIPPDISVSFSKHHEVSAEKIGEIMAANPDKSVLNMVLKGLQTAVNLQTKITMNKFTFSGVSIKLGIPPSVSLNYTPTNGSAGE